MTSVDTLMSKTNSGTQTITTDKQTTTLTHQTTHKGGSLVFGSWRIAKRYLRCLIASASAPRYAEACATITSMSWAGWPEVYIYIYIYISGLGGRGWLAGCTGWVDSDIPQILQRRLVGCVHVVGFLLHRRPLHGRQGLRSLAIVGGLGVRPPGLFLLGTRLLLRPAICGHFEPRVLVWSVYGRQFRV